MSKGHLLRALVNQRLSAAAEEVFALFEQTIREYEEELCRSLEDNRRKQQLLNTLLSDQDPSPSLPSPGVNQEILPETAPIKEETEERDVKQEEDQLQPVPVPEFRAVCVKTEELPLPQQEQSDQKKEAQGADVRPEQQFHSEPKGHTEHEDDWGAPFCSADERMDTEGDIYSQVQLRDTSTAAQLSGSPHEYRSAPDTSATNGDVSDTVHGADRKKHQCFVCQKRFDSKILLEIHIRVHTGEKPYSCPVCKKAFAQKNNLNAHTLIHTGEKPYSCSLCNKTFGRKCTLKRHMKIHIAQKASPCDKADTVSRDLQTYMRTHTYL